MRKLFLLIFLCLILGFILLGRVWGATYYNQTLGEVYVEDIGLWIQKGDTFTTEQYLRQYPVTDTTLDIRFINDEDGIDPFKVSEYIDVDDSTLDTVAIYYTLPYTITVSASDTVKFWFNDTATTTPVFVDPANPFSAVAYRTVRRLLILGVVDSAKVLVKQVNLSDLDKR